MLLQEPPCSTSEQSFPEFLVYRARFSPLGSHQAKLRVHLPHQRGERCWLLPAVTQGNGGAEEREGQLSRSRARQHEAPQGRGSCFLDKRFRKRHERQRFFFCFTRFHWSLPLCLSHALIWEAPSLHPAEFCALLLSYQRKSGCVELTRRGC